MQVEGVYTGDPEGTKILLIVILFSSKVWRN